MTTIALLLMLVLGAVPVYAHHGTNFFATATADTVPPEHNVVAVQGAYFRPELGPSTGQRMEITPMYVRGISEDFHLETHLHWMTNPAEGLDPSMGVFEGFAIAGRHRLPDLGSEPGEFPFRLAVAAQMDIPTAHAMKTLGAGPGGLFHLILSRTSSNGVTFAANLSSSVFTHLECAAEPPTLAEAPRRQDGWPAKFPMAGWPYSERQGRGPCAGPSKAHERRVRRQHAHLEPGICASRDPRGEFEWGFALGIRKTMSGNLAAGAEFAREVEYPPGINTIIGFYWTPEPDVLVRWGVAFPVGFEEDIISVRLGAALSF